VLEGIEEGEGGAWALRDSMHRGEKGDKCRSILDRYTVFMSRGRKVS
jgi:hypothetical protein